jgi:hypothetical protein
VLEVVLEQAVELDDRLGVLPAAHEALPDQELRAGRDVLALPARRDRLQQDERRVRLAREVDRRRRAQLALGAQLGVLDPSETRPNSAEALL